MTTFGFGEVLRLTDTTRGQLTYWTQTGLITAAIRETAGTGHHRVFSGDNLVEVAVAAALARYGVSVASIRRVLTQLQATPRTPPDETPDQVLFLMGDPATPTATWAGTRAEFIEEMRTAFFRFDPVGILLDVGQIRRALDTRTAAIAEDGGGRTGGSPPSSPPRD